MPNSIYSKESTFRFLYIFISFFITLGCSYFVSEQILKFWTLPLENTYELSAVSKGLPDNHRFAFIFTEVTEAFSTYLKISVSTSLLLSLFFVFYQVWLFIKPGLYPYEKRYFSLFFGLYSLLFFFNLYFLHQTLLPACCQFFLSFESTEASGLEIHLEAKIYPYIKLVLQCIFSGLLIFQIPTVIIMGIVFGLFTKTSLIKKRPFYYLVGLILSFLISPPDFSTQWILGFFLLFLYEISIFCLLFVESFFLSLTLGDKKYA